MEALHCSALRAPNEDDDAWLDRVEELLVYNRDNRAVICNPVPHEEEVKTLTADRHCYAMWWDFYAVTEALVSSSPSLAFIQGFVL